MSNSDRLPAASVPPEPPTLSDERIAQLQSEFAGLSMLRGADFDDHDFSELFLDAAHVCELVAALRAELAEARAAFEQALSRTNDLTGRLGAAITERTVLRDCVWKLSAAMLEAKIWTDEHEAMFERATDARHVPRNWRRAARAASGETNHG